MNACCCHPDLHEVVLRTVAVLAGCLCRREEAALRLVLERREAELREAMKLRHSLTTLLHALRANMERVSQTEAFFVVVVGVSAPIYQLPSHLKTLSGGAEAGAEGKRLARAEADLGDHLTGGVVQRWRQVQRRLLSEGKHPNAPFGVRWRWRTDLVTSGDLAGQTGVDTDQDKLLARLESDLKESQQLVRLQQQLLQVPQRSTPPPKSLFQMLLQHRLSGRAGQPGFPRPPRAGRLLLPGRVATSAAAPGGAASPEEDLRKRAALLHRRRRPTEPRGEG